MKIIVSHVGKQHVNALLVALFKQNVLTQFYTSIAANKIRLPKSVGFKKGNDILSKIHKQRYTGIDDNKITHFPLIAGVKKIVKSEYKSIKTVHKWFDKKVAKILQKADFDIVIGYETSNLETFKTAKQRRKITVLDFTAVHHEFQNPILEQAGVYSNPIELEFVSNHKVQALQFTDYIIALSTFAEKTLVDYGFPADRIYKTYLGINQSVFKPKNSYNTEGVSTLELYFIGTLSRRKALPFLMQVLDTLIKKGLNIRLTLIGPVDDFTLPEMNVPHLRYFPFLNHAELVAMHHQLDLFVFPSNIDSWAQVVIEAMACGSPILVSENTGAKDAVAQGGGDVLPVGNLDAWVKAIEKFYYNRNLLKEVGEEAALVAQQYTWEAYHQQVFDVMTDIFNRENNIKTFYGESKELV
jgi:glycosyltransferase involved in cell wall biosynthesis